MPGSANEGTPIKIVFVVLAGLAMLCCVGGSVASYLGWKRVDEAGGVDAAMRDIVASMAGPRDVAARDFMALPPRSARAS